jgi:hypothetical protein
MTNSFPAIIFIWLLIWLFKEEKKEVTPEIYLIPEEEKHPMWKVRSYSNGRLLPNRHLFYYCEILQLQDNIQITDESIERAAYFRQSLISSIDAEATHPYSRNDITTAKAYLIDRWLYMTSWN